MIFFNRDLLRLRPALSIGVGALKVKYVLILSAVIALQLFLAYRGYVEVADAIANGRSWGVFVLMFGLFFMMTGLVANTLIARLSYAMVVLRKVREKDPLY